MIRLQLSLVVCMLRMCNLRHTGVQQFGGGIMPRMNNKGAMCFAEKCLRSSYFKSVDRVSPESFCLYCHVLSLIYTYLTQLQLISQTPWSDHKLYYHMIVTHSCLL